MATNQKTVATSKTSKTSKTVATANTVARIDSKTATASDKKLAAARKTLASLATGEKRVGIGRALNLLQFGIDGAMVWLLGWENRRETASAIENAIADGILGTVFSGAEKLITVRTGKGQVTTWGVREAGKFYERTHKDALGEWKVVGLVAHLRAISI